MAEQQKYPEGFNPDPEGFTPDQIKPQMNFAVVNGQQVDVDTGEPLIKKVWGAANTPLINPHSGVMRQAMDAYAKEHPVIGGIGNFATDILSSMTSPLSIGLMGTSLGANAAKKLGLSGLEQVLHTPGRLAAGGMVMHGGLKAIDPNSEYTPAERVGGGIEAGLGALGLRGLKNAPMTNEPGTLSARLSRISQQEVNPIPSIPSAELPPIDLNTKPILRMQGPTLPDSVQQLRTNLIDQNALRPEGLLSGEKGAIKLSPLDTTPGPVGEPSRMLIKNFTSKLRNHLMGDSDYSDLAPEWQDTFSKIRSQQIASELRDRADWADKNLNHNGVPGQLQETQAMSARFRKLADDLDSAQTTKERIKNINDLRAMFDVRLPGQKSLAERLSGESGKLIIYTRPKFQSPIPAVNDLFEAIRGAKPQVIEQEKLYSIERAKRAAAFESVGGSGEAGAKQAMSKLAGELPKVDMQTTHPITQQSADQLFDMIRSSGRITPFEKASAITGLGKVLSGQLPQRSELNVLGRIFGPELASEITYMHGGFGSVGQMSGKALMEASNLMKTMMASTDVSAPLRQGLPLAYRGEYWRAFDDMFKSLVSEKQFQGLMRSLEERPNFLLGRDAGLMLTDLDSITSREEQFLSKIAEKIPGVRASERAYVGFLDKLRADTFDSLLADAVKAGNKPEEVAPAIARFVNVSTGRGSLGRFEKIAPELNTVLFSPRLISSRLTMLNPSYYVNQPPMLRKEAIKALLTVAGGSLTINGLTKLGAEALGHKTTISTNPLSSDFLKAKVGNTRVDPNAGFQQYIVAASRLLTGKEESSTSGKQYDLANPKFGQPTRLDVVSNFTQSKLSPMAGLIAALLKGKDPTGKPVQVSKELKDRFIPLFIQDVMDVYKDDPSLLPLGLPAAFGTGMQTYK